MSIDCKECGVRIDNNASICPTCGERVKDIYDVIRNDPLLENGSVSLQNKNFTYGERTKLLLVVLVNHYIVVGGLCTLLFISILAVNILAITVCSFLTALYFFWIWELQHYNNGARVLMLIVMVLITPIQVITMVLTLLELNSPLNVFILLDVLLSILTFLTIYTLGFHHETIRLFVDVRYKEYRIALKFLRFPYLNRWSRKFLRNPYPNRWLRKLE